MDDYGQMQFNANIHSQGDMDIFGISGTYQFEDGYWAGKDGFQSYYGADGGDPVPIVGALETVNLMGKKPQAGNHVWFSWAATSQPSAQQQNMYMMSDALAEWSSNIILSAMGGYASSGLTSSMTMARGLSGVMGKQAINNTGSMTARTLSELQIIAKQNSTAFRQLFGTGKEGAQAVLNNIKNVKVPEGLSREAMQAYRELINRVPDPTGTQAIRAKILEYFIKQ